MSNVPRRSTVTDSFPRWMGHPAVVLLYVFLVVASGWTLVDVVLDDSSAFTVVWRVVVFIVMSWLLWLTANVWRRRRPGRTGTAE